MLKFWNLVSILKFGKILKFGQNFEIWSKFWNLVEIWSKFWNLVKILKFGQNFEVWLKFWNFVKILKFGQNFEILSKFWKGWLPIAKLNTIGWENYDTCLLLVYFFLISLLLILLLEWYSSPWLSRTCRRWCAEQNHIYCSHYYSDFSIKSDGKEEDLCVSEKTNWGRGNWGG